MWRDDGLELRQRGRGPVRDQGRSLDLLEREQRLEVRPRLGLIRERDRDQKAKPKRVRRLIP